MTLQSGGDTKKKVLYLGKMPPPYMGTSVFSEVLIKSEIKNAFQFYHFNTNIHLTVKTIGTFSFSKIIKNLRIYRDAFLYIKKVHPHLIHIPISQSTIGFYKDSIFILIGKFFGAKIVIQLHGSEFKDWVRSVSVINYLYVKMVLGLTSGVMVLASNLKDLFSDFYDENKIFVVPNGANYEIRNKKEKQESNLQLLYLSTLHPRKGIEDILKAVVILKKKEVPMQMNVVGEWYTDKFMTNCLDFVKEHNLPVRFCNEAIHEKKFFYYAESDIFLFTPREPEGLPWVIIEALAAGLPVIATNQGAIIDAVIDRHNGFIVEAYNPQQIARKIELLANELNMIKVMGQNSREIYVEKFTEEKMIEKLSHAYSSVIEA